MADPDSSRRISSEVSRRPASLRSVTCQSHSPSPHASTSRPRSRLPSSEIETSRDQPPDLPEESTIKPRGFQPFFTLVSDTTTSVPQTHHPKVHYIFADDDDAFLADVFAAQDSTFHTEDPSLRNHSNERAIILDLAPKTGGGGGYVVARIASLSDDWAVTSAELNQMQGESSRNKSDDDQGTLMLKIQGVGLPARSTLQAPSPEGGGTRSLSLSGDGAAPAQTEYAQLIQDFEARMSILRKTVEAAEARRQAVEDADALDTYHGQPVEEPHGGQGPIAQIGVVEDA